MYKKISKKIIQVLTTQPYIQPYLHMTPMPSNIQSTNIAWASAVCLALCQLLRTQQWTKQEGSLTSQNLYLLPTLLETVQKEQQLKMMPLLQTKK